MNWTPNCLVPHRCLLFGSTDSNPEQAQKTLTKVLFGMVVRERRRISALARTASSLDDKLQQRERAAEESEANLRAYRNEQKQLAAEQSRSQQKSILSLMEMVKSDGKATAGQDTSTYEDRKLLVLANERIAVLENQIQHLESEASQERDPPEELLQLQDAYKQECAHRDEIDGELRRTLDTLEEVRQHLSNIETDQDHVSMQSALGLIHGLLSRVRKPKETERESPTKVPAENRRSGVFDGFESDADLVASDDEDGTEDNDWTKELMEDLAFIDRGEIPPFLQDLPGFAEQVAEVENVSSTDSGTGSASVFDRLTNPANFTGTQKLKAKKTRKNISHRPRVDRTAGSSGTEQLLLKTVSNDDDAVREHQTTTPHSSISTDTVSSEAQKSQKRYKSVFERLVSPSQATGTQRRRLKTKNHPEEGAEDTTEGEAQGDEEDLEKMLDDALGTSHGSLHVSEKGETPQKAAGDPRSFSDSNDSPPSKEGRKASEYAEQDVFERLQRTSTVSYQNRQGEPIRHHSSNLDHSERGALTEHPPVHGRSAAPNVQQPSSSNDDSFAHEEQQTPYTSLNVFERLTKTTTEAYAKKVHRPRGSDDHY